MQEDPFGISLKYPAANVGITPESALGGCISCMKTANDDYAAFAVVKAYIAQHGPRE